MSIPLESIDHDATTWFTNIGAFPLPHPFRELDSRPLVFHPARKYRVVEDDWMKTQPTLVKTSIDEDLSDVQMHPKEPGSPQFDKAADDAAAQEAVDKFLAERKPEIAEQKAQEDAAALAASQAEIAAREKAQAAEAAKQTGVPVTDAAPAAPAAAPEPDASAGKAKK